MLVYTRIPDESAPEAHLLAPEGATVGDLLDQVRRARSARGREVALAAASAGEATLLAELGIADGDLLDITVFGTPVPMGPDEPVGEPVDFAGLIVSPTAGAKRLTEYEEMTQLLQWHEPFHIEGPRPSQTVWSESSTVLQSSNWEAYRTPDKMYYRTYVAKQARADRSVSTAFRFAEESDQLAQVDPEHLELMRRVVGALQYPDWGLCMLHQHITRFAMSSWIAGASSFMMFDELRHAQLYGRLALTYGEVYEGFEDPRPPWMEYPEFQGVRRLIEELLTILDWGKAFVIGGMIVEPVFTATFHSLIAGARGRDGDTLTPFICQSIAEDKVRHRESVAAFIEMMVADPEHGRTNSTLIEAWVEEWLPAAAAAAQTLAGGDEATLTMIEDAHARVIDSLAAMIQATAQASS